MPAPRTCPAGWHRLSGAGGRPRIPTTLCSITSRGDPTGGSPGCRRWQQRNYRDGTDGKFVLGAVSHSCSPLVSLECWLGQTDGLVHRQTEFAFH